VALLLAKTRPVLDASCDDDVTRVPRTHNQPPGGPACSALTCQNYSLW